MQQIKRYLQIINSTKYYADQLIKLHEVFPPEGFNKIADELGLDFAKRMQNKEIFIMLEAIQNSNLITGYNNFPDDPMVLTTKGKELL